MKMLTHSNMLTKTISIGSAFLLASAACLCAGEQWTTVIAGKWTYSASEHKENYTNLSVSGKSGTASLTSSTKGDLTFTTTSYQLSQDKASAALSELTTSSTGWGLISEAMHIEKSKISVTPSYNPVSGVSATEAGKENTLKISGLVSKQKYRLVLWLSTTAGNGSTYQTTLSSQSPVTWDNIQYGYMSTRSQEWKIASRLDEVILGGTNRDSLFAGVYAEFTYEGISGRGRLLVNSN